MIYLDLGGGAPGLLESESALVPALDRGFLYGDGLFETMLLRDGAVPLLRYHLERLQRSAEALLIPYHAADIRRALAKLIACCPAGEYALRLTLTRGLSEQRGYTPPSAAQPTLMLSCAPYRPPTRPLTAITASIRLYPESLLCKHKSLSALERVMARSEAARAGVDEALLRNVQGDLAEGAAANLFVRRGARYLTPPLASGCLPGVMRRRLIEMLHVTEERLTHDHLWQSDGVYLTSALMGCAVVGELDGRPLPVGDPPLAVTQLFAPLPPLG